MKQPRRIDKTCDNPPKKPKERKKTISAKPKVKRKHPQYGTSKLEEDFARNFLDKLGVDYVYQFEAKDIGRYFDFFIPDNKNGFQNGQYTSGLIIEVDGSYFHGDPRLYEEKDLNRMQKKNMRVDEYKNKWAHLHGYPIMRIWESDIRKKPKEVLDRLRERLYLQEEKNKKKGRNLGKNT